MAIKRILVTLGGTPYAPVAVQRSVELALAHGARLTALPLLDLEHWQTGLSSAALSAGEAAKIFERRPWQTARQRVERAVENFLARCRESGVRHDVCPMRGDALSQLAAEARYHDLLVFGLRGLIDYSLVPDPQRAIAWLIRQGVRPILAVPAQHRPIRRALVAYSGTQASAKTMKHFVQMALWPGIPVTVACFQSPAATADDLLRDATAYCRDHGLEVTSQVVSDPAAHALLPFAEQIGADVIALGDGRASVLSHDALGETVWQALRQADRPLFVSH